MSIDIITYSKLMQYARKAGFVGTKDVDETGLADENIIYYSEDLDKYVTKELRTKIRQWKPNAKYEKDEVVIYDSMIHLVLENHTSHQSSIDFDLIEDKIMPLATQAGLANILGLEYVVNAEKTEVELTWSNPTSESFEGRDIYVGENVDIMNMSYDTCEELAFQSGSSVKKISTGLGTGLGEDDSIVVEMEERKIYYFKIFAMHGTEVGIVPTTGRYTFIENPDVTPPTETNDLVGVVEDGVISLSWTQPTDDDFMYAKIIKSKSGIPVSPEDGQVLDTVEGLGVYSDNNINKGIEYFYRVFFYDDAGNGFEYGKEGNWSASNGISLTDVAMYGFDVNLGKRSRDAMGLVQEDFNVRYPWSDIVRGVANELGEIVYYLDDENSEFQENGITPANLTGSDGNVVVEYPEFFYSYSNGEMLIANEEFEGSKKFDRTIVGAFEATENLMGELQSVVGIRPLTGKSISEYRLMSGSIGAGWHQKDIEFLEVLKMLFVIEYGGLNSQDLVGNGVVDKLEENFTGSTVSLGNRTGVSADGAVSYRGLENPWGNTWEFVEGLYLTDEAYFKAESNYDSFLGEGNTGSYTSTGEIPATQDGFMSKAHDSILLGSELLGDNVSFTGDYQYSHKPNQVNIAVHGGDYKDGDKAGLFRAHMGLKPFGKEEDMDLVEGSVYEKELTESDLEQIKSVVVSQGVV